MAWASLSDFLSMGGYGFYVWGSFLVFLICLVGEVVLVLNRRRTLLKQLSLTHEAIKNRKLMIPRNKKLAIIIAIVAALGFSATLVLDAFQSNLVFFFSPSQVAANEAPQGKSFRIGGLVEEGSVKRESDGVTVSFVVTDTAKVIPVLYTGILPDLFKEGKGVVAQGKLSTDGVFRADEVLAKHDENYMPPEAAEALEQASKSQETLLTQ